MAEKATKMSIKVDLQCSCCYKKIKEILCKFPQIQDQIYEEKQNKVLITVVCCSPEKIKQKIICEGGETVESIEILLENPLVCRPPALVYPVVPVYPMVWVCSCPQGYGRYGGGPCYCGRRRPVMCYDGCGRPAVECKGGSRGSNPGQGRSVLCYDGCGRPSDECQGGSRGSFPRLGGAGTCDDGCGRPADECKGGSSRSNPGQGGTVTCADGCGRPAGECQGGNGGHHVSLCDNFTEANAHACIVM
ncbi:hypothetical protein BT93_E2833 [Corymbia citriodora subsp. variegata]|nr:hypothetical protein BT93_E2833 [Corymbia citriodora subsp. variegata]